METIIDYEKLDYVELNENLTLYFGDKIFVEYFDSEYEEVVEEIDLDNMSEVNVNGYVLNRSELEKYKTMYDKKRGQCQPQ